MRDLLPEQLPNHPTSHFPILERRIATNFTKFQSSKIGKTLVGQSTLKTAMLQRQLICRLSHNVAVLRVVASSPTSPFHNSEALKFVARHS